MAMTVEQAYQILSKFHGYTGPRTKRAISQFVNARDLPVAVKNRGGLIGMQEGGDTEKKEKPSGETVETENPGGEDLRKKVGDAAKKETGQYDPIKEEVSRDYGVDKQERTDTKEQQEYSAEDIKTGQAQMMGDVMTGKGDEVARKSDVDYIDPITAGTNIDKDTGQLTGEDPQGTVTKGSATDAADPDKVDASTVSKEDLKKTTGGVKQVLEGKIKRDAEGNPILDEEGNPIREGGVETKQIDKTKMDTVEAQKKERPKLDAEGNPVLDADGNPIMETYTDLEDVEGAKLTEKQKEKLKMEQATRELQEGEKIEGTGVDMDSVGKAFGTGEVEAASVKDEIKDLLGEFDDGQTPAWAAQGMRKANQMLAARGLSASSMAGQAVIQAMMESALPIAQIDASNKQEMAMLKARERAKFMQQDFDQAFQAKVQNAATISEIANLNFTAEQQVNLENSRMAQTVALKELDNDQALVMANAAQIASLETQGLSNQQQAQVENAKNFLQADMANLDAAQQTELFKAQKNVDALFTDAAAENARLQFNATSENQVNEFNASLKSQVKQFNAAQTNAMAQFNAGEENAMEKFNETIKNQRDQFNATNSLVIAQANAQWRQGVSTANTAAENNANMDYNKEINGMTGKALDQIWQRERDLMSYSFSSGEKALDRIITLIGQDKLLEANKLTAKATEGASKSSFIAQMISGIFGWNKGT
jgi:hypothetical protein